MPMSSLPSPYGIGTMGKVAYEFVDFLKASGQKYWQLLPLGPTSYGDSPYYSFSTFAGNPYFIDLDLLVRDGLLRRAGNRAVQDVGFTIAAGETFGIVGESGCGKSTVARLVMGLEKPDAGEVLFHGQRIDGLPERRLRPLRPRRSTKRR